MVLSKDSSKFAAKLAPPQERIASLERQLSQLSRSYSEALSECERLRNAQPENPVATEALYAEELEKLCTALNDELFALPGVDGAGIYLLDSTGTTLITADLRLQDEWRAIEKAYKGFHHPMDHPEANVEAIRRGEPLLLTKDNHAEFGETTRMRFKNMNMHSLLLLPLTISTGPGKSRTIGVASVFSSYLALALTLSERLAAITAPYTEQIHRCWVHRLASGWGETVQVMYAEIQQHIAFITEMNSAVAVEPVFRLIGQRLIERFDFDLVGILLAEEDTLSVAHISFSAPHLKLHASYEEFRHTLSYCISVPDGSSSLALSNNQRFLFHDAQQIKHLPMTDKDRQSMEHFKTLRTFVMVPIRFKNDPVGILWLGTLDEPLDLSDADLALIELLASYISAAIRNAKAHSIVAEQKNKIEELNRDLQQKVTLLDQESRRDKLTGLHNYGSFDEELRQRTQESLRHPDALPLSTIMIDVDHFKKFNDSFGHPAGNQVLQEVAAHLLKSVRDIDFVARYGGEEFVVLLPHCPLPEAQIIAERIRQRLADSDFIVDGRKHHITISGGCTQLLPNESHGDFVRRADQALYAAKQNGRNRIESIKQS